MNCDYYGYVKSIALAVAADFLEDYHSMTNRYSIHGSCIDINGQGIVMIAPSNTGKTTHSFGLLLYRNASLVSDDWLFVRLKKQNAIAYSSERNSYIRDDIGKNWKIFQQLVDNAVLDKKGRGIASVQDVIGLDRTRESTTIKTVLILKRDASDERIIYKLSPQEAIEYLSSHYYCNPYQLVMNERKIRLRTAFFGQLFSMVDVYMVNTVKPPDETQSEIRKLVDRIFR
jgi:serine kinase of HPr protein (carbohydrate metabolism regulator)